MLDWLICPKYVLPSHLIGLLVLSHSSYHVLLVEVADSSDLTLSSIGRFTLILL